MLDYLGLSNDRLSHGLLVGFLCLIFSLPAFSFSFQQSGWVPDGNGGYTFVQAPGIPSGTSIHILTDEPGWTFSNDGAGGIVPSASAPPLDVPLSSSVGPAADVAIPGIVETSAIDAADLGASAAPDILAIARKALPLVGPALTLWQLYGVIEGSSGSAYNSAINPYGATPSCNSDGSYDMCEVGTYSNGSCQSGSLSYGPYSSSQAVVFADNAPGCSGCPPSGAYSAGTGPYASSCSTGTYTGPSSESLQSWTAAQTAATIANDIANYLGSNPSQATNLANDLAAQPGGTPLSSPTPINYSGPSTATGNPQTVTTTNPDGSTNTQTVTPTVNITYGPDVSVTNDTTTKNYYCGSGASPSTASVGSAPAPVSSTNSTGTCAVTSATTSGLVIPDSAVAPTESFPSAPTVSVVDNVLAFNPTVTSNGQCPANNTFVLFGTTYNISWQPICGFASDIYPFVTASGAILAGVLIFR